MCMHTHTTYMQVYTKAQNETNEKKPKIPDGFSLNFSTPVAFVSSDSTGWDVPEMARLPSRCAKARSKAEETWQICPELGDLGLDCLSLWPLPPLGCLLVSSSKRPGLLLRDGSLAFLTLYHLSVENLRV